MQDGTLSRILIVEDARSLAAALEQTLKKVAREVRVSLSAADAKRELVEWAPEFVLLDVALPDGSALDVLETIRKEVSPAPCVIAMSGSASPAQSFELAGYGVRGYLTKPVTACEVLSAFRAAAESPPDLVPLVRASVGRRSLAQVEEEVRSTMLREALAQARGSRRRAASLLAVTRQMLQHAVRRLG